MRKLITTLALLSTLTFAGVAGAQTTVVDTTDTSSDASSSIGVPNTGAGGDAPINYAILATSAAVAIAAAGYALRQRKTI